MDGPPPADPCVLVVGFRLRWVHGRDPASIDYAVLPGVRRDELLAEPARWTSADSWSTLVAA